MAFTEALRLLIDADTGGAVRGIQKVGQTTDRELGRSQKTIEKWSRGLTTAGAGMVALGSAALLGLGKAAQASEEANLATVKLENTLQNMPRLAGENSKQFIDLADAIQGKTAADADAIVEAEALLGTFQLTADEIKKITPLVVDYSRKFGVDLPSAAVQVGKALDGNIGALKRVGISIDETAFAADRFGAVQAALRDQVGGFAEAEGKTFAGSLERLKNELGDVAEGVGTGAVDAFTSLFGVVDGGIDKIKSLSPATQEAIGKFATFGSVALIAAGGLSFTIGQLIKAKQNFDIARAAVADFAGAGGLGRLARVSLVIGGFIALREVLQSLDNDLKGIDVATLENQLLDLSETGKIAGDQLTQVFENFGEAISSGDPQKIEAVSNQLGKVDEALAQLASRDPEAAAASFRAIRDRLVELGASRDQVKGLFDDYAAATTNADTASRTAASGVDELGGAMGEQGEQTSAAQDALQEYLDTLSALFDPLFGATDALLDNQQAQQKVAEAELALAAAVRDHGAGSVEAAAAQRELTEAQLSTGKSALDVSRAMAELSAAVDDGTVSVADARGMLATWVRQGLISQSTAAALSKQFDSTTAAAKTLGATDPNVKVTETGNRAVQGQLGRTKDAAFNIPPRRHVSVTASDRASGVIRGVISALNRIPSLTTTVIRAQLQGSIRPGIQVRQHGGPVRKGEAYVVGEREAEVFVPDRNGTILPSVHHLGHMGDPGTGGGTTVNYHMTFNGPTNSTQVIEAIKSYERSNGTGWRN